MEYLFFKRSGLPFGQVAGVLGARRISGLSSSPWLSALAQAKAQEVNARNDLSYTEVKSPVDGVASMIPYRVGALVNSSITEPLVTVSDDSEVYGFFCALSDSLNHGCSTDVCPGTRSRRIYIPLL